MSERKEEDLKEEVNSSDKEGEIVEDIKISVSNIDDLINLFESYRGFRKSKKDPWWKNV